MSVFNLFKTGKHLYSFLVFSATLFSLNITGSPINCNIYCHVISSTCAAHLTVIDSLRSRQPLSFLVKIDS